MNYYRRVGRGNGSFPIYRTGNSFMISIMKDVSQDSVAHRRRNTGMLLA